MTDAKRGGVWGMVGGWMERVTVINDKRRQRLTPKDESRGVKKK